MVVILNKTQYDNMIKEHLEDITTYRTLENVTVNPDKQAANKIAKLAKKYSSSLTKKEIKFIAVTDFKTSYIYCLPKIHKDQNLQQRLKENTQEYMEVTPETIFKGRPIVGGTPKVTGNLAILIDILLKPYIQFVKSFLRDDFDFLSKIPQNIDCNEQFVKLDVVALYPSINHEFGLEGVAYFLNNYVTKHEYNRFPKSFILEALEIILKNCFFIYNNTYYHQTSGTSMGSIVAPVYATLAMGFLEIKMYTIIRNTFTADYCSYIENNFKRFLDDCFIIWDQRQDLKRFIEILDSIVPTIKFTVESDPNKMDFLDIILYRDENNQIITDIFYKQTNSHRYVDFFSNHPAHVKRNIPLTLAQRICSLVKDQNRRNLRLEELRNYLVNCTYPEGLINRGIEEAIKRSELGTTQINTGETKDILPLVVTHCPEITINMQLIKNDIKFNTDSELKELFKNTKIIVARRQPKNLRRLLCNNSKVEKKEVGVKPCLQSRCKLCSDKYVEKCENITNNKNEVIFKIESIFTCNSENVIYALQCNGCKNLYVGQTVNLRNRLNLHKSHVAKSSNTITLPCSKHFASCNVNPRGKLIEPYFKAIPFWHCTDRIKRLQYEENFIQQFNSTLNSL